MGQIDLQTAVLRLKDASAVRLLTHGHPDGDTLGSAFALAHALEGMGKAVCVECSDPLPAMFAYMAQGLTPRECANALLVSVDVADEKLLGDSLREKYHGQIDLNIDHHATNTSFAAETYVDPAAAATAEIVSDAIDLLGIEMTREMAACIYAGVSTDTGCFRYANTTARSHRTAARCMELGVATEPLDRAFFETKTRTYLALERMAMDGLRYYCNGKIAVIAVTQDMYAKSGSNEDEYIKLVARTRQIEGVQVGVAIRERLNGTFKISLRTHDPVDAAAICAHMGGGGHVRAAGCASDLPLEDTVQAIVEIAKGHLRCGSSPAAP
jgi:phosphoesterase RecJ-like protein